MSFTKLDETKPVGTDRVKTIDDEIRQLKLDINDNFSQISGYPINTSLVGNVWTTATRPTTGLVNGIEGFNTTIGTDEYWDSSTSTWKPKGAATTHTHTGTDITSTVATATTATSVDWSGIGNKPTTYTATAHAHVGGDITSKVASATYADSSGSSSTSGYATSAGSANAVTWDNVSGKPLTFNPSSHGHDGSYITGKVPSASYADSSGNSSAAGTAYNIPTSDVGGNIWIA